MRRREFLLGAGAGIAAASPSRAQPSARPQVGVLFPGGQAALELRMPPFRDGMFSAAGPANPDIEIVSRIAAGNPGRLPALATELVAMGVRAILAVSAAAVRAARNATATTTTPLRGSSQLKASKVGTEATGGPVAMSAREPEHMAALHAQHHGSPRPSIHEALPS
jgi:hypothetical protein